MLDSERCIGSGLCVVKCPADAIELKPVSKEEWFDVPNSFNDWEERRLAEMNLWRLSSPQAVECHAGRIGVNGPLIDRWTSIREGNPGNFHLDAKVPMTSALCESLSAESIYFLVTTSAYPDGEIRGHPVLIDAERGTTWGRVKGLFQ